MMTAKSSERSSRNIFRRNSCPLNTPNPSAFSGKRQESTIPKRRSPSNLCASALNPIALSVCSEEIAASVYITKVMDESGLFTRRQRGAGKAPWEGQATEPKTRASCAPIPIIPMLAEVLRKHRQRLGNPISGPMFPASNGKPASLNNVLGRQILPALNRCAICGKDKPEHIAATVNHKYKRDELPKWHGWHGFRRALATVLHDLKVDDLTIQKILRHANVSVTRSCYIKTLSTQTIEAMQVFGESADLCANRALKEPTQTPTVIN
jgi:hypothetical protein